MSMKRAVCLLAVLLLLAGCSLRNRRPSEDFVPGVPQTDPPAAQSEDASGEPAPATAPAIARSAVRTVLQESGTVPGSDGFEYRYEIPVLDLPDAYAAGCNREINERFEAPARDALEAIAEGRIPEIRSVTYAWDVRDTVLTLRLTRIDAATGADYRGIYSVNAETGAKVTLAEFCRAAGIAEDAFGVLLRQDVEKKFRELVRDRYSEDQTEYTTALTLTLSWIAEPASLPMYLTEDGKLSVTVSISDPGGGISTEELLLP